MLDLIKIIEGIVNAKLKMLGSDLVCNINSEKKITLCNDYLTVIVDGGSRNLVSRKLGYLALKLVRNALCKIKAVGNEYSARHFIVLSLREQIRRNVAGICRIVGNDKNPEILDRLDIKIFVDTDADVRILRRIQRDVSERGRDLNSVIKQYLTTVKPMHEAFVEPSKRYADIIVPEGGMNRVAIEMITQRIISHLEKKGTNIEYV